MITIAKIWTFDAAHRLDLLPPEHKCHRMHGHTYRVEARLRGQLDATGIIIDYDQLDALWSPIADEVDHRVLNDIESLGHPTTENLAMWIWERFRARLAGRMLAHQDPREISIRIRVYESSTTFAQFPG